jgi:hypothetical protein
MIAARNLGSPGDSAGWILQGMIRRDANAASTSLVGVVSSDTWADGGAGSWQAVASADNTNGCLIITVTGETFPDKDIRWVCKITTVEVTNA